MEDVQIRKLSGVMGGGDVDLLIGGCHCEFTATFTHLAKISSTKMITSWLESRSLMVMPIIMVVLSLLLHHSADRWANIVVAVFFFCSAGRDTHLPISIRQISSFR
ncbi:MAG: hypothetical protein U0X92_11785 [Anaerolineales bacterium]